MQRKLAALMVGDVVGYSALMERAEERTAELIATCHALIDQTVQQFDGRVFKTAGDAALAEFPSAINALRAAVEIRTSLVAIEDEGFGPLRMRFGLHIADVMIRAGDLIGDGVNLATRIQTAAEPDSIYVSEALFDHVRRNSPFIFDDMGERTFKNIREPIHLYRVRGEIGAHRLQAAPTDFSLTPAKRPQSVAVLPFRVSSEDASIRYLAEGFTEELIVELSRFRRLAVSSRSASFALADLMPDPVKVGETLAVHYVLDGQIRRLGERVTIALRLSETNEGSVIWSDRIVRPVSDLIELVSEIARRIVATVVGRIDDVSMVAARRKPPSNMTAFDYLLRGLDHHRLGGVTDENARQAVGWFTKAIEADPNYAVAYAWRCCSSGWLPEFDIAQGRNDARRALELDPNDAEANRIMAALELISGNYDGALAHAQRAMELNPADAYIRARCAAIHTMSGNPQRSLVLLDEAEALDPLLPVWCVEERGIALYAMAHYSEALEALGRLTFQTIRSRLYRVACLMLLGRRQEAELIAKEARGSKPDLTASAFATSERYRDRAMTAQLSRLLETAGVPS